MNARFRDKENKSLNFLHTLNGSCLAVGENDSNYRKLSRSTW